MQPETKSNQPARNINKPGYIVFLLAGIYFMIRKDFSQAATFWCLALVFDPFDLKIAFKERPVYPIVVICSLCHSTGVIGISSFWKLTGLVCQVYFP